MKTKSIITAALAALTFAACSNNGDEKPFIPAVEGEETNFTLSITLPPNGTRATQDATVNESKVNTVYVYVFNYDGTPANKGEYTKKQISEFSDKGNNRYEMIDAIKTSSGDKRIYVATNLPVALEGAYSSEAALLAKLADVQNELLTVSGGALEVIVMTGTTEATLVVEEYGDNVVEVELDRAVARVIATSENTSLSKNWGGSNDLQISIKDYFVVQDAYRSYFMPNFYSGSTYAKSLIGGVAPASYGTVVNSYDPKALISAGKKPAYVSIVADRNDRQNLDGFYIGENVPNNMNDIARNGNTTYVYVQTVMNLAKGASVKSDNTGIEYNGDPIVGGSNDLYLLRVNDAGTVTDYLCHEDQYQSIVNYLANVEGIDTTDMQEIVYPKGYVYYRVWLNKNEAGKDQYNVYRNQFIHIDITDVTINPGEFGGGYPGDEGDAEVPTDPNVVTPAPEPIDEQDATLLVNITVKPWTYVKDSITLE